MSFSSVSIAGPNAADFSKTDLCTPAVVLQPNGTCTISITYSPAAPGTSQATLTVTDNAAGSPQGISLTGTAVAPPAPAPVVSLNPSGTLNFPGTTTQGTNSAPQNITLTNTGTGTLHVISIAVSGFNASDFTLGTSNCVGTVAAQGNCLIPITFAPLAAGIRTATLNITDDAADSPERRAPGCGHSGNHARPCSFRLNDRNRHRRPARSVQSPDHSRRRLCRHRVALL